MRKLDFKKLVGNPAGQGDRPALKLVLSNAVLVIIIESKARVRAP